MVINFFRGNDYEVKFKFKTYSGTIDQMWLTVKCESKIKRLQKKLGNGIEFIEGYYVVTFVPDDTYKIPCDLTLTYDIKIITGGKRFTVIKDKFKLEDIVTESKDEV